MIQSENKWTSIYLDQRIKVTILEKINDCVKQYTTDSTI